MSDRSRFLIAGAALLALAGALRIVGLDWGLPQVYEEATPLKKAWAMWGWGSAASFDPNPHFFKYPTLTIYVQVIGQAILYVLLRLLGSIESVLDYRALYLVDQTPFMIMGRALSTAFGLATVWLLYVLGRRVGGRIAGLAAAFLLAVNTYHISAGQVVETDVALTCFAVLTLWRALVLLDAPSRKNAVCAGIMIGLATSAKYPGAFLVFPVVAALVLGDGTKKSSTEPGSTRRRRWRLDWRLLGLAAAGAATAFFITSPFVVLDFGSFWQDLAAERQHMRLGHFGDIGTSGFSYYLQSFSRTLGWPLFLAGAGGLVYFAAFKRRPWAVCVSAFVVPYLAVVGSWSTKGDRYVLPVTVLFVLFASALLAELLRVLERRGIPTGSRLAAGLAATAVLALTPLLAYPAHLSSRKSDSRTSAKLWIEANVPSGAFIAMEWHGPEFLDPVKLWQVEPEVRRRVGQENRRPVYAVQMIPMFQVAPERSAPYYDLSLYSMADLIITSSGVRDRYELDRERFGPQLAFYDSLEVRYEKILEFVGRHGADPTIAVFLNRKRTAPFASREDVDPPSPIPNMAQELLSGEEAYFYYSLGLNYEAFGFHERALQAYQIALRYPMIKRDIFYSLSVSATRTLMSLKRTDDALQFLDRAVEIAPTPREKDHLRRIEANLRRKIETVGPP